MGRNEHKKHVGFLGVMFIATVIGLWVGMVVVRPRVTAPQSLKNEKTEQVKLQVGESEFLVEVRDDDQERALGLSFRETLEDTEGMVFVFDSPDRPVFWMKDMLFDLDVVWIRDGEVVGVQENVPAPTLERPIATTMVPLVEVDMVLEVPAGVVERQGISLGDEVSW